MLRVVLLAVRVTASARADEAPVATIAVSSATSGSSLSGNLVEGMAASPRTSSVQSGGRDLVETVALGDGGRLDLDHDLRLEEPGDAEERAHGLAADLGPERHQLPGRAHEAIDVGRIKVRLTPPSLRDRDLQIARMTYAGSLPCLRRGCR